MRSIALFGSWRRGVVQLGLLAGVGVALVGGGPGRVVAGPMPCQLEGSCTFKKPRLMFVAEYSHAPWAADVVCCGVEQYTAYVADHVRGFVDAHYRTATAPGSNTIVGSSRGGLAAFYLANRRPEVFGQAGCLSSSFWIGLDPVFGGDFPGGALADSALVTTLAGTLADPRVRPKL